MYVDYCCCGTL